MMKEKSNIPFFVPYKKEIVDSEALALKIKEERWVDDSTIIVCCFPYYSSITCQLINHKLSHLNQNELFEQINMEFPYPNMSQVWNGGKEEWQLFDTYLGNWVKKYARPANKYLFLSSSALTGKNLMKLKLSLKDKIEDYKFGSLYINKDSVITPHYYIQALDYEQIGRPIFEWENASNPNWTTTK